MTIYWTLRYPHQCAIENFDVFKTRPNELQSSLEKRHTDLASHVTSEISKMENKIIQINQLIALLLNKMSLLLSYVLVVHNKSMQLKSTFAAVVCSAVVKLKK